MKKQQQRVEADLCHAQNRISLLRLQVSTNLPLTEFNGALRSAGKVFATGTVLCASLTALPAFAGTLYSQPPSTFLSTMLSQADVGFTDGSAWVNDDFIATQSGAITNISWQGDAQPAGNNGFTITIIPVVDASGNPYTPTLPELATVTPLMTVTVPGNAGQALNKGTLYNFNAVLPTSFNLVKGTRYWINIESTGLNPWGWANGTGGNASINYCQQTPYVCTLGVSDRAFSLNDTTVTASLVSGEVNVAYPATVLAGTLSGNSLLDVTTVPPGLTVNQGTAPFTVSGTPTQAGNYTFTVIGNATDDIFNITIASPVALATTTLTSGTEGTAYSATVIATGGATPYNWSISGLPAGLTYAVSTDTKTVTLSGTPAAGTAGLNNVAFTVTDAAGGTILPTSILGLTIGAAPVVTPPVTPPVVTPPVVKPPVTPPVVTPPIVKPPVTKPAGEACTKANAALSKLPLLQGSARISAVGNGYIRVGEITLYHSTCATVNFKAPATKFVVGETATWKGHKTNGVIQASTITVKK
jgi:Putative Ig domain